VAVFSGSSRRQDPPPSEPQSRSTGTGGGGAGTSTVKLPGVPAKYRAKSSAHYATNYYPSGFNYTSGTYPGGYGGASPRDIPPRYKDGDQLKPVAGGAFGIAETKRRLVLAGYLDIDDVGGLSIWNEEAVQAYQAALIDANRMGMDVGSLLMQSAIEGGGSDNMGGGGGGGSGGGGGGGWMIDENGNLVPVPDQGFVPEPLELKLPNKDDLRRVFRSAIVDQLGEGWSSAQIEDLVNTYSWKFMAAQTDAYAQRVARDKQIFETGTSDIDQITETSVEDPTTFAENEARRLDPGGVQATDIAEDYAPEFFNALGGFV
jgi:hypothetical protein